MTICDVYPHYNVPVKRNFTCFQCNSHIYKCQYMISIDSHLLVKVCSTCSNYVTLLPKLVKNFNICRHNVYEHVPTYGIWFINVIYITFGVRYSLNTNLNIISSILSILPHIYWLICFKCYHIWWGIFTEIVFQCILVYSSKIN